LPSPITTLEKVVKFSSPMTTLEEVAKFPAPVRTFNRHQIKEFHSPLETPIARLPPTLFSHK